MPKYSSHDHYVDAAGVLKNRLNIGSETALEEAEAAFAGIRSYELAQKPLPGKGDCSRFAAYIQSNLDKRN
ncbi:MAG TPA: hypothetical protein VHC22_01795 [Pirellulales bacterium]|nr:hypothetical protein [Pirellulales bacterium]